MIAAYDGPSAPQVAAWLDPLLSDAASFAEARGGRFLGHARGYRRDAAWIRVNADALLT